MEIKDNQITTGNITGNNNATNVTIKKTINNINFPLDSILAEFIKYMNTLILEKKIKIIQFALKQKDSEAI